MSEYRRGSPDPRPSQPGPDREAALFESASLSDLGPKKSSSVPTVLSPVELDVDDTRNLDFHPLPARIQPGATLGDFVVEEELHLGGLASVYRARQRSRDRVVALKVLSPHLSHVAPAVQRFQHEFRLAARIVHPGIVPVYASGFEAGYHFYAMKLLRGPTLRDFIDRALGERGEQFFREGARLFAGLARAVAAVHAAGVVHQDLKPSNIFLTSDGRLILADFGVAVELDADRHPSFLTPPDVPSGSEPHAEPEGPHDERRAEEAMGTPAYMAPERFIGARDQADIRNDIYSLGLSFYELLTGMLPFPDVGDEEMARIKLTRRPPSPRKIVPQLPLALEAVVRQAIEVQVPMRYRNAADMARDLDRFIHNRRTNKRSHQGKSRGPEPVEDDDNDFDPELAPII